MQPNNCPYCHASLIQTKAELSFMSYLCDKKDHDVWWASNNAWYIRNKLHDIIVNRFMIFNDINKESYIIFNEEISIIEAGNILIKFLKLKSFI